MRRYKNLDVRLKTSKGKWLRMTAAPVLTGDRLRDRRNLCIFAGEELDLVSSYYKQPGSRGSISAEEVTELAPLLLSVQEPLAVRLTGAPSGPHWYLSWKDAREALPKLNFEILDFFGEWRDGLAVAKVQVLLDNAEFVEEPPIPMPLKNRYMQVLYEAVTRSLKDSDPLWESIQLLHDLMEGKTLHTYDQRLEALDEELSNVQESLGTQGKSMGRNKPKGKN